MIAKEDGLVKGPVVLRPRGDADSPGSGWNSAREIALDYWSTADVDYVPAQEARAKLRGLVADH